MYESACELVTSNIKTEEGSLPYKIWNSRALVKNNQHKKWLLILGDNSSQLPVRKCPAGAISYVNFTLTSSELYFFFDPYGN